MARVFISYKRADKDIVFPLKDKIETIIGEPCWIDLDGIESDAQFVNVIIRAINECEVFLFMYSHHHAEITDFERDWTIREINLAEKKHKRIVFVNIDQTPLSDYFEMLFGLKQQVDATSPDALERLFRDFNTWGNLENSSYTESLEFTFDEQAGTASLTGTGQVDMEETTIKIPPVIGHNGRTYSVTNIGKEAFWQCFSLKSISIPDSIKSIGECAFFGCNELTTIGIPYSVSDIASDAFEMCEKLTSIIVAANNTHYTSIDGVLFNKDLTTLVRYPEGKKGAYTIPDHVINIEEGAFAGCTGLTSIIIPNSVIGIGDMAFCGCCNLNSIIIPNSVLSIGEMAFEDCTNLSSVTLSNILTGLEMHAFGCCTSLTSIYIPPSVKYFHYEPFWGCENLATIILHFDLDEFEYENLPKGCQVIRK